MQQTYLDTTVVAPETDKGQGLLALLELAGAKDLDTVAIGDSEPDLPMFRVARRSFAPRHISGRDIAQQLGCRIAARSYQPGLLSAVRSVVHPRGDAARAANAEPAPVGPLGSCCGRPTASRWPRCCAPWPTPSARGLPPLR